VQIEGRLEATLLLTAPWRGRRGDSFPGRSPPHDLEGDVPGLLGHLTAQGNAGAGAASPMLGSSFYSVLCGCLVIWLGPGQQNP